MISASTRWYRLPGGAGFVLARQYDALTKAFGKPQFTHSDVGMHTLVWRGEATSGKGAGARVVRYRYRLLVHSIPFRMVKRKRYMTRSYYYAPIYLAADDEKISPLPEAGYRVERKARELA